MSNFFPLHDHYTKMWGLIFAVETKQIANFPCGLCVIWYFVPLTVLQQLSVNTVQFMIPVVQDVSKHVTTGTRLAHATSPVLQDATVQQI